MDLTQLKAEHPDTYNKIMNIGREAGLQEGRTQGAQAEADRIKDVEAQLIPGHEKLIAELKADGKTTGAEAAVKVLAAENLIRNNQLNNLQNDTTPHVPAAQDDPDANHEEKAAVNAMVAGMNKKRS